MATYDAIDLAEFARDAELDEVISPIEETTRTALARDLKPGDVLLSAALGGVWDSTIQAVRVIQSEVYLGFAGADPVCLGEYEVCTLRR